MAKRECEFDVVVIGAGVNGAGIARDAALRGLRVIVFDKNDMCSGTSAFSSRLIHGGLRYLEYGEIPLVYESLHERRYLRNNAPHLVKPLRITIPIFREAKRGPLLIRLGMLAYDILSFRKSLPAHEMLDHDDIVLQEEGLRETGLRGAARYFDAQVTFAERLVLENLLAARAAGASLATHSEVLEIRCIDGAVSSVVYVDSAGGEREATTASVVNASGPWVDQVLSIAPRPTKQLLGGTKGSHIVVGDFDGAPSDAFYVEAHKDGRPFFIIPWNGQYLIGTTDIRYTEDLNQIRASRPEVDYLLTETNRVFPRANLQIEDIHFAYAGVRPLPHRNKGPESAITRRHIIKTNRKVASGLISIVGGKLTTYRNLAEQCVDKLARVLQRKLPRCRTQEAKLPGAFALQRARQRLVDLQLLTEIAIDRLLDIYGGRAAAIAELAVSDPELGRTIDESGSILAAEVVFTIREEFPRTLQDVVFRRMMIGFNPDQGRALYRAVAKVAAAEFRWMGSELEDELAALHAYADSLRV